MSESKYKLSGNVNLAVPSDHVDKLLSLGNGTSALLYLYAIRENGNFTAEGAAKTLKRTAAEISSAAELLRINGLFASEEKTFAPLPSEELPQYTSEEVVSSSLNGEKFRIILDEAQHIFGKVLTRADINTLFGLYDYLKLPPEVIILLINYCMDSTRERLGPGKLPSMRTIEKEGYAWYNDEIITLDRAEEYLCKKREYKEKASCVKRVLQINDRGLSSSENKYICGWLSLGFGLDAIEKAYDKTVLKTGRLQWKYMDSILSSWHSKDLHTLDEIVRGDIRPGETPVSDMSFTSNGRTQSGKIREMMDKL